MFIVIIDVVQILLYFTSFEIRLIKKFIVCNKDNNTYKKLLISDWLRAVQFKCTPVQKV